MLVLIGGLSLAFAAATAEAPPVVGIDGARPVDCHALLLLTAIRPAQACFLADPDGDLALRVEAQGAGAIHALRHAVTDIIGPGQATSSGIAVDGREQPVWTVPLALPRSAAGPLSPVGQNDDAAPSPAREPARPGLYRIGVELDGDAGSVEHDLVLAVPPPGTIRIGQVWPVPGTALRFAPDGCWVEAEDPVVTLSLRACADPSLAVKLVVVTPPQWLGLEQYVTNSVEAYSRTGIWHVEKRRSMTAGRNGQVSLSLKQTIAGKTTSLVKEFIGREGKFVVVTGYPGHAGEWPAAVRLKDWLVLDEPRTSR